MHIAEIFLWFILYSILGWIYETIYCSVKTLKWDNRGMLIGPYCPIYGVGAILAVLLCNGFSSARTVFLACMAGSAILEYTTSCLTERFFHAVWWDYSGVPLNVKGRICLPCSIGFGCAGLLIIYRIHPHIVHLTAPLAPEVQELAALLLMAVFSADCTLTADSLTQINVKLEATMAAIDLHIAEKYNAFIENARQDIGTIKERISLEEYRERRTKEEVSRTVSTLNRIQSRALRSVVSFPRSSYSDIGTRIRHALIFHRRKKK